MVPANTLPCVLVRQATSVHYPELDFPVRNRAPTPFFMILEPLVYLRSAVADGEVWRLATATIAHLSVGHLLLNLGGLALVVLLLRPITTGRAMALAFAVSALAATLGVHLATRLDWYAGASSATLGLLAWGVTRLRRPWAQTATAMLLIGAIADLSRDRSVLGEPLAPWAHLFGIAGGLCLAIGQHAWSRTGARRAIGTDNP